MSDQAQLNVNSLKIESSQGETVEQLGVTNVEKTTSKAGYNYDKQISVNDIPLMSTIPNPTSAQQIEMLTVDVNGQAVGSGLYSIKNEQDFIDFFNLSSAYTGILERSLSINVSSITLNGVGKRIIGESAVINLYSNLTIDIPNDVLVIIEPTLYPRETTSGITNASADKLDVSVRKIDHPSGVLSERKLTLTNSGAGSFVFSYAESLVDIIDTNVTLLPYNPYFIDNNTVQGIGTFIYFTRELVFNTPSSPGTENITFAQTGAKIGVVQKIYHNSGSEPTFTGVANVVRTSGVYQTGQLNRIYAEWVSDDRVEYRIENEASDTNFISVATPTDFTNALALVGNYHIFVEDAAVITPNTYPVGEGEKNVYGKEITFLEGTYDFAVQTGSSQIKFSNSIVVTVGVTLQNTSPVSRKPIVLQFSNIYSAAAATITNNSLDNYMDIYWGVKTDNISIVNINNNKFEESQRYFVTRSSQSSWWHEWTIDEGKTTGKGYIDDAGNFSITLQLAYDSADLVAENFSLFSGVQGVVFVSEIWDVVVQGGTAGNSEPYADWTINNIIPYSDIRELGRQQLNFYNLIRSGSNGTYDDYEQSEGFLWTGQSYSEWAGDGYPTFETYSINPFPVATALTMQTRFSDSNGIREIKMTGKIANKEKI